MAGHGRDLGRGGRLLAISILSPIAAMALGFGPMKTMPAFCQRAREGLALGQKAVARMHRLGAGRLAGLDDLVDQQIALRRRRRADRHGLVGHLDVQRVAVGVGIDRDRLDAHPARGLDDPAGDLAAVGDQDALEHACSVPRSRDPLSSSVASPMLPAGRVAAMRVLARGPSLWNISALTPARRCSICDVRSLPGPGTRVLNALRNSPRRHPSRQFG